MRCTNITTCISFLIVLQWHARCNAVRWVLAFEDWTLCTPHASSRFLPFLSKVAVVFSGGSPVRVTGVGAKGLCRMLISRSTMCPARSQSSVMVFAADCRSSVDDGRWSRGPLFSLQRHIHKTTPAQLLWFLTGSCRWHSLGLLTSFFCQQGPWSSFPVSDTRVPHPACRLRWTLRVVLSSSPLRCHPETRYL